MFSICCPNVALPSGDISIKLFHRWKSCPHRCATWSHPPAQETRTRCTVKWLVHREVRHRLERLMSPLIADSDTRSLHRPAITPLILQHPELVVGHLVSLLSSPLAPPPPHLCPHVAWHTSLRYCYN